MEQINTKRVTAEVEGDFVVFLIGMRINKLRKIQKWLPITRAMARMIRELNQHKEMGMLSSETFFSFPNILVVQYWRSFDLLTTYAGNRDAEHFPAWVAFNKQVGSSGDVGIFHETYKVGNGQHESLYHNMPAYGLGKAGTLVSAVGRKSTAAGRIQALRRQKEEMYRDSESTQV